jgi:hypothetical protein
MMMQLLVGGAASLINFAIHALWTVFLDHAVRRYWLRPASLRLLWHRVLLMMGTAAILMTAHVAEVLVWATTYVVVGSTPPGAGNVYFAFVNYTTLGYGDIVPVTEWQLLGPMTAMNGILLFGWSTATIFEVLRASLRRVKH